MPLHARGTAMPVVRHTRIAPDGMRRFEKTRFGEGEAVDVHGTVTALSGNIFVEGVPGDALHVVGVFSYFLYTFAW